MPRKTRSKNKRTRRTRKNLKSTKQNGGFTANKYKRAECVCADASNASDPRTFSNDMRTLLKHNNYRVVPIEGTIRDANARRTSESEYNIYGLPYFKHNKSTTTNINQPQGGRRLYKKSNKKRNKRNTKHNTKHNTKRKTQKRLRRHKANQCGGAGNKSRYWALLESDVPRGPIRVRKRNPVTGEPKSKSRVQKFKGAMLTGAEMMNAPLLHPRQHIQAIKNFPTRGWGAFIDPAKARTQMYS